MDGIRIFALVCALQSVAVSTAWAASLYPSEVGSDLIRLAEGGFVLEPNTGCGEYVVLNRQSRVSTNDFQKVFEAACADVYHFEFRVVEKEIPAKAVIEVVDGDGRERLAVYPDSSRAVVDVAALAKDSPDQQTLVGRTRKEMIRAFLYLAGSVSFSDPKGTIVDAMTTLERLDAAPESIPPDLPMRLVDYSARIGIRPWFRITYKEACEKGVAEKPATDYQRKIWDAVHEKPVKGIEIKFDKKVGR